MSYQPNQIWQQLSVTEQQDILVQLALICKEIIDDIRTHHHTASSQQSYYLCQAINTAPNID